jgi:DNA-binding response OmpR family regulator
MQSNAKREGTRGDWAAEVGVVERRLPEIETGDDAGIAVLSVSPSQDDHEVLDRLLRRPKWEVHRALSLSSAVARLEKIRFPLVLCERDLLPGTWKEMLDRLRPMAQPPHLIVTSRLADDYLWAEALNIGAYDVVAKPFDQAGLTRILSSAWLHWRDRHVLEGHSPKSARQAAAGTGM